MLKPVRFSCSQKIWLNRDPPVADNFISKVDKIYEKFIGIPAFVPEVMDTPTLKRFAPLTPSKVTKLIGDMQTKSCELDPIPTHVLKQMLPVLISTITQHYQHLTQPHLLL